MASLEEDSRLYFPCVRPLVSAKIEGSRDTREAALLVYLLHECRQEPDICERDEPKLVRTLEQELYEYLMQQGLI
jgi:hypothetical protein